MKERRGEGLGAWGMGCVVFHACFYKIFTSYPRHIYEISGTAAWLTVLCSGLGFLLLFGGAVWILQRYRQKIQELFKTSAFKGLRILLAAYWLFSAVYALREFTVVLQTVAYLRSPLWFLGGILLLGSVVNVLCGKRAVFRIQSLLVPGIAFSMAAVAILGFLDAEPAYLTPWLGNGSRAVFAEGLSSLFLYTDSILIFLLLPRSGTGKGAGKGALAGAALAVFGNVLLVLASSMSHAPGLHFLNGNLIYPLAKAAYFGKFWSRLDALYIVSVITSAFLQLSMAMQLLLLSVGKMRTKVRGKSFAAMFFCFLLCLPLSGCYDSQEVEKSAYTVALGVDKGETERFLYTFQLSNPLELGGTIETEDGGKTPQGEEEAGEENKTVSNISIEAADFYLALDQLKSHLSKAPNFSHLKVIVFSEDAAREGILSHASLLFREVEVRPSTNVCLAGSAKEFLGEVKPTLEQSTARYYELLFQNHNTPYAPVSELREFVSRGVGEGRDAVLPIADREKLSGIGVFRDGKLVKSMGGKQAMLYRFLTGDAEAIAVRAGESTFTVDSHRMPKIEIDRTVSPPRIFVKPCLKVKLIYGNDADVAQLSAQLDREMTALLQDTLREGADILGIGDRIRQKMLLKESWESLGWRETMSNYEVFSQTRIEM